MLVAYVFNSAFGANKEGDIVQLDPEQASALVDAGIISEASEEHVNAPQDEGADVPPEQNAALTRAVASLSKNLEQTIVKTTEAVVSRVAKTTPEGIAKVYAEPKQPVMKSLADLCRTQYKATCKGDTTARNKLDAYQAELRQKTPAGMYETSNAAGGYSVIPEWYETIWDKVRDYPKLLDMCDRRAIQGSTLNIPAINETSLADGSRHGGILGYWVSEGAAFTSSYPALTQVQLVKQTLSVLAYVTNQLLEDNSYNLDSYLAKLVGKEMLWQEDDAVVNGSGSGQPTGLLNAAALVTVNKEGSQSAATIVFPNLAKMMAALYPPSRPNSVFLATPQAYQQLVQMTFPTSSGTFPAPGLSFNGQDEFQLRYLGRPIVECFNCSQLGNAGDIILADLSQLVCAESSGMDVAISTDIRFTTYETAFRFARRFDLKSPWTGTVTNKGATYSPFVVLQTRGT